MATPPLPVRAIDVEEAEGVRGGECPRQPDVHVRAPVREGGREEGSRLHVDRQAVETGPRHSVPEFLGTVYIHWMR